MKRAHIDNGRIVSLVVGLAGLPDRTIDREEAIRWMRDGHSLVPVLDGRRQAALQLVEIGEAGSVRAWAIRTDNQTLDEDRLPPLPNI